MKKIAALLISRFTLIALGCHPDPLVNALLFGPEIMFPEFEGEASGFECPGLGTGTLIYSMDFGEDLPVGLRLIEST